MVSDSSAAYKPLIDAIIKEEGALMDRLGEDDKRQLQKKIYDMQDSFER